MIAYGIDKQTSPRFSHRTLTSATVLDARQVSSYLHTSHKLKKKKIGCILGFHRFAQLWLTRERFLRIM